MNPCFLPPANILDSLLGNPDAYVLCMHTHNSYSHHQLILMGTSAARYTWHVQRLPGISSLASDYNKNSTVETIYLCWKSMFNRNFGLSLLRCLQCKSFVHCKCKIFRNIQFFLVTNRFVGCNELKFVNVSA